MPGGAMGRAAAVDAARGQIVVARWAVAQGLKRAVAGLKT
jgi:hypothetical protein